MAGTKRDESKGAQSGGDQASDEVSTEQAQTSPLDEKVMVELTSKPQGDSKQAPDAPAVGLISIGSDPTFTLPLTSDEQRKGFELTRRAARTLMHLHPGFYKIRTKRGAK